MFHQVSDTGLSSSETGNVSNVWLFALPLSVWDAAAETSAVMSRVCRGSMLLSVSATQNPIQQKQLMPTAVWIAGLVAVQGMLLI